MGRKNQTTCKKQQYGAPSKKRIDQSKNPCFWPLKMAFLRLHFPPPIQRLRRIPRISALHQFTCCCRGQQFEGMSLALGMGGERCAKQNLKNNDNNNIIFYHHSFNLHLSQGIFALIVPLATPKSITMGMWPLNNALKFYNWIHFWP